MKPGRPCLASHFLGRLRPLPPTLPTPTPCPPPPPTTMRHRAEVGRPGADLRGAAHGQWQDPGRLPRAPGEPCSAMHQWWATPPCSIRTRCSQTGPGALLPCANAAPPACCSCWPVPFWHAKLDQLARQSPQGVLPLPRPVRWPKHDAPVSLPPLSMHGVPQGCKCLIAIEKAKLELGKPDPDSAYWN